VLDASSSRSRSGHLLPGSIELTSMNSCPDLNRLRSCT
jgi:hypothetical protein